MSAVLNGASTARVYRDSGLVTSTGAMTLMNCFKRTGSYPGSRMLLDLVKSTVTATGHSIYVNTSAVGSVYAPNVSANLGALSAAIGFLYKDTWVWQVFVGNGTDLICAFRPVGASVWSQLTVTQTAFAPTQLNLGGSAVSTGTFPLKIAHSREWNAALIESEWTTEMNSATHVRTTNILSVKSFIGANLTAALLGQVGVTFTAGTGVTLDTDEPSFGPTILGLAVMPTAEVSAAEVTMTTPSTPVLTVVNSDTVSVAVSGIDASATHVVVQAKKASDTTYVSLATVPVGLLPASITDLDTGTAYNFRVYVQDSTATNVSDYSTAANATTKTLYVDGYVNVPSAANETGIDVQVWRAAPTGHLVGEHIDFKQNQQFDGATVEILSVTHARIRVALSGQPATGAKLRNGNTCCLVARKIILGNELWSHVMDDALVVEA